MRRTESVELRIRKWIAKRPMWENAMYSPSVREAVTIALHAYEMGKRDERRRAKRS